MLENRRSLASYFDEGPGAPTSWYDQTQLGQGLTAYTKLPDEKKKVWVPDGQEPDDKPDGKAWHKRGAGPFKPNQWGYDPTIASKNAAKRKENGKKKHEGKHKGEHHEERKKKNGRKQKLENHLKRMMEHEKAAMTAWAANAGWEAGQPFLVPLMGHVESALADNKETKNRQIKDIKRMLPIPDESSKDEKKAIHNQRNAAIHKIEFGYDDKSGHFIPVDLTKWLAYMGELDKLCDSLHLFNVLGTSLPEADGATGRYHSSVGGAFLAKIKRQIMAISLAWVESRKGRSNEMDKFILDSLQAEKELHKLMALKKKPKAADADPTPIQKWHKYILAREIRAFKAANPEKQTDAQLPYYLKRQLPKPDGYVRPTRQESKDPDQPRVARARPGPAYMVPPPPRRATAYMHGYNY